MLKENIPEIISRFKNGEREAFSEIIKAYQRALLNFVYRFTRDRARAEDYAQTAEIEKSMVWETLIGIKRAGADLIVTYWAKTVAQWLKEGY